MRSEEIIGTGGWWAMFGRRDRAVEVAGTLSKLTLIALSLAVLLTAAGCQELEEALDNNTDIIVRNDTSQDLWIEVDGERRGKVGNKGNAENVWDNAPEGVHTVTAYSDPSYRNTYCRVTTNDLRGDDDFQWYLEGSGSYSGSRNGQCQ
jgi:hypothetical protein